MLGTIPGQGRPGGKAVNPQALARFPLWRDLPEALLATVAARMTIQMMPADRLLVSKGEASKGVFFVVSGLLKVWDEIDQNSEEVTLGLVAPGGMFGERSIIDDTPHHAFVTVLRDATLLRLPPSVAAHFFFAEPLVARRLMQRLSALVDEANAHRRAMSARNAALRLWRVLVSLSRETDNGQRAIDQLPSQEELARLSGLARETVSRLLSNWRRKSQVIKAGRGLALQAPPEEKEG